MQLHESSSSPCASSASTTRARLCESEQLAALTRVQRGPLTRVRSNGGGLLLQLLPVAFETAETLRTSNVGKTLISFVSVNIEKQYPFPTHHNHLPSQRHRIVVGDLDDLVHTS